MLKHLGNFKDVPGPHLVGKILEAVLPIIRRSGKVARQRLEEHVALTGCYGPAKAHFIGVGNRNQNEGIRCGEPKRIKRQRYCADLLLLNLFDCADPMVGVNDFLADLEAHLFTSDSFTSTWLVASCAADRKLPNERMVNRVITLN